MKADHLSLHFINSHPKDAARELEKLNQDELITYILPMPDQVIASLLEYFNLSFAAKCFESFGPDKSSKVIKCLDSDYAILLLRRMSVYNREQILNILPANVSTILRLSLRYPDGVVGAYMNPDVLTVSDSSKVMDIFDYAKNKDTNIRDYIYIVDDKHVLKGQIAVKELLAADKNLPVIELARKIDSKLLARQNIVGIQDNPAWIREDVLPVIDYKGRFQGVLTKAIVFGKLAASIVDKDTNDPISDSFMSMAELFWFMCIDLLINKK